MNRLKSREDAVSIGKLFDRLADTYESWQRKNYYYHGEIERFYSDAIPNGKRVMEIGSATGTLLSRLKPSFGVGIDVSARMVEIASKKFPRLKFINSTIENCAADEKLDYVVISNLLEYVPDLYDFFKELHGKIGKCAKLIITGVNPLWAILLKAATRLRLRTPIPLKNFVTLKDIENMLSISEFEVIESGYRLFLPLNIPLISCFLNKLMPRLPILRNLCLVQYIIARPKQDLGVDKGFTCSVIVPCHNEEGNIEECARRIPEMGNVTEILVVDDGSTDNTASLVREIQKKNKNVNLISYIPNRGKGAAVKTGFDAAKGDIVMILDADMAVAPEELVKFYNVLASRQAEFVNGTRMVYDMAPGAMKFLNYLGNKMFGILLSFIIGQRNTDTLCGTKAFYKSDYVNFRMGKCPWGDFDLLFEAARMKLKTVEMPVHYYPRVEGKSKMKAFRHGAILLRMCWRGFWYLG
ncbi:MAG: glycosyltransferase [Candidatus Omnitrophota bacterium]